MPKVLISDTMSSRAEEIFRERGVEVDVVTELDPAELEKIIVNYDGLAVRSSTKVTEKIIEAGSKLRVIGRAGIGVDNIDVGSASKKGIVVMNTPQGNSITTAEHAIALLFLLREIYLRLTNLLMRVYGRRASLWVLSYMERHSVLSVAEI